jgi:hypothetical protein
MGMLRRLTMAFKLKSEDDGEKVQRVTPSLTSCNV